MHYPYILFGAGCDFHETETIAGRLRQGNFGRENIRDPKADFSIYKDRGLPTINIFLKSEWDQFKPYLKTFVNKDLDILHGPATSLAELSRKKTKRKSITLVRKVD